MAVRTVRCANASHWAGAAPRPAAGLMKLGVPRLGIAAVRLGHGVLFFGGRTRRSDSQYARPAVLEIVRIIPVFCCGTIFSGGRVAIPAWSSVARRFGAARRAELPYEYRDRIFIRKDIILKLAEYGELNQTRLLSYCGLNLAKHRPILDDLEEKGIIIRTETRRGDQRIMVYNVTQKGLDFCSRVLEPYEEMFPRKGVTRLRSSINTAGEG